MTLADAPPTEPPIARPTIWALAGQGLLALSWLVTVPFLVRFLGTDGYGTYSLIQAIVGCLIFADFGMGVASTRFAATAHAHHDAQGEARAIWTALLLLSLPLLLTIAIVSPLARPLLRLFGHGSVPAPGATAALEIAILAFVIRSLSRVLNTPELVRMRMDLNTIIAGAASVATVGGTILVLLRGGGLVAVLTVGFIAALLELVVHLAVGTRLLPALWPQHIERRLIGPIAAFGAPMLISYAAGVAFQQSEKLLLAYFATPVALAHYSVAFLVSSVFSLGSLAFGQMLVPPMARLHAQDAGDQLRHLYRRVLQWTSVIAVPVAFMMVVVAPVFFAIWVGPEYAAASTRAFRILVVGAVVNLVAAVPYVLLLAAGQSKWVARCHLIEIPLYIPVAYWLTSHYGTTGAATAWTLRVSVDAVLLFTGAAHAYDRKRSDAER